MKSTKIPNALSAEPNLTSVTVAVLLCVAFVACGDQETDNRTEGSLVGGWANLPPAGKYSRGHIEIPAERHRPPRLMNMLTIVKTDNWIQHHDGSMEYVDAHLYGEIFALPRENISNATLTHVGNGAESATQFPASLDYRSHFYEGGYFADLAAMDSAFPGSDYRFDVTFTDGRETSHSVAVPQGQFPGPATMSLYQDGERIGVAEVDPDKPLTVRWTEFTDGTSDPNGILDDLVTIAVNDCGDRSGRIFVTGEPTLNGSYLTFEAEFALVPAATMSPGRWYWLESEFSNVVATSVFDGAPVQATYMNSVYLSFRTVGGPQESYCTESMPRFD